MKIAIKEYNFLPKYLIYWTKQLYIYISFNLNNGSFIVVNFLFWNCHIKALDKGDLVLIIFDLDLHGAIFVNYKKVSPCLFLEHILIIH
jgi:hypothetical protein